METTENEKSKRLDESTLIGLSISINETNIELVKSELKLLPTHQKRKMVRLLKKLANHVEGE